MRARDGDEGILQFSAKAQSGIAQWIAGAVGVAGLLLVILIGPATRQCDRPLVQ